MEMCRTCMAMKIELLPLDESFITSYNLLTNLNVNLQDNMPQYYCQGCADTVKHFIEFRDKSISIEQTLRNLMLDFKMETSEQHLVQNECDIKIENIDSFGESTCYYETNEYCSEDNNQDDKPLELKCEESIRRSSRQFLKHLNKEKEEEKLIGVKVKKSSPKYKKRKKTSITVHEEVEDEGKTLKNATKYEKRKNTLVKANVKVEDDDKTLHCGICPIKFDELNDLQSHLETHKSNKACGTCNDFAMSWPQLFGHRIKHLPVNQKKCYLCNNKKYTSSLQMEYHYLVTHFDGQEKHITCKLCCRKYLTPRRLKKHLYSSHAEIKFFCDYCSKGYRCKSAMKSHIKVHLDYNSHSCDVCDYTCRTYGSLQRHKIQSHCPAKTTCKICTRIFENQEKMDSHKCSNKVVVCSFCGLQLTGPKRIAAHLKMHQGHRKTFDCTLCPTKYKTKGALKAHLDRHKGVRTQICEYCDAKFYTASTLIKHRRIHTGEKPYVCKICEKAFTGNHNLKMHMRVHGQFLIVKKNVTVETVKP